MVFSPAQIPLYALTLVFIVGFYHT